MNGLGEEEYEPLHKPKAGAFAPGQNAHLAKWQNRHPRCILLHLAGRGVRGDGRDDEAYRARVGLSHTLWAYLPWPCSACKDLGCISDGHRCEPVDRHDRSCYAQSGRCPIVARLRKHDLAAQGDPMVSLSRFTDSLVCLGEASGIVAMSSHRLLRVGSLECFSNPNH
nr:hypothetical protein CFP56_21528 [Quercus suber]